MLLKSAASTQLAVSPQHAQFKDLYFIFSSIQSP